MSAPGSPEAANVLLHAAGVSKTYGLPPHDVTALRDVNLTLTGGKIYGLLGPNGAGKTTFLRICATMLAPTAGSVTIAGYETVAQAPQVRAHLGYLSATTGVYERLQAREVLQYFGRLHGMDESTISRRTDELFEELEIEFGDRPVGKLSTGMRQKVSIARAFLHNPPVVILDEPTNGLDVVVRQGLLEMLRRYASPERLIILSTHDLPEAHELCDAFVFIDGGQIIGEYTRADLAEKSLRDEFFAALTTHSRDTEER
ncbi:MAG: ABC transporter ATP-binding protein [Planctomycetota bacterium]